MHVIQTLPWPTIGLCTDPALYVRTHRGAGYSFPERAVLLNAGDWCSTDTYFGVIPTAKWARHTAISRLEIVVDVVGQVDIEAVHNRNHFGSRVVAAEGQTEGSGSVTLVLPPMPELADGHVFVRVRARQDGCRLRGLTVHVPGEPLREVRLGVSITTFNRQEYVRANVARLDQFIRGHPELAGHVQLQLVDNGRNLQLDPPSAVTTRIIGNRNLGGAGGFARGLMELRDAGWATHVLFMDDDLTFEPEVIARIIALLSYVTDEQMCISGAMLREELPNVQFEAGAVVKTSSTIVWHAVGHDRDLRDWRDLLANDADEPFDYGGWWCFAFPIDLTDDYPIPIFVRGDDVCFGVKYCAGHMMTINGIGVWHQDFAYKNGPASFFYEARNIPIMLTVSRPDYEVAAFRKRMIERTLRFTSAFKYDTARAFLDGVEAYLAGPDALLAVDADDFNGEVRGRYGEGLSPLPPDKRAVGEWKPPRGPLPHLWRVASLITLGGHLLPARARRGRSRATRAEATPVMASFATDEIVYRHDPTGDGFVARRDNDRFKEVIWRMRHLNRRMNVEFESVSAAWRAAYPKMVSDEYWRDQFSRPPVP